MPYFRVIVAHPDVKRRITRYYEADTKEAAEKQRARIRTPGWDIASIDRISQADYIRGTRGL